MKKAVIYYFSGCGNTKFVAESVCINLEKSGYEACLVNIEENISFESHSQSDIVGFVFPVYAFGFPQMAMNFLTRLPKSDGQKAFLFATPAGHEGIAILKGIFQLKRKGYDLVRANSIYMNDTWVLVMDAPNKEQLKSTCDKNEALIESYIKEIIDNKKTISIANPILMFILGIINYLFHYIGRHQAGKSFSVNKKCNSCKTCFNTCPSKTIKWLNNRPYWSWNCQQCYRCINTCPQNAVEISGMATLAIFIAIVGSFFVYHFIPAKFTNILSFIKPIPQMTVGIIFNFLVVWIAQIAISFKLIPDWYITKSRKRYNFSKILNSSD